MLESVHETNQFKDVPVKDSNPRLTDDESDALPSVPVDDRFIDVISSNISCVMKYNSHCCIVVKGVKNKCPRRSYKQRPTIYRHNLYMPGNSFHRLTHHVTASNTAMILPTWPSTWNVSKVGVGLKQLYWRYVLN